MIIIAYISLFRSSYVINVEQLFVEPSLYDKILRAEYALQNTNMPNIRTKFDFTKKTFFKSKS